MLIPAILICLVLSALFSGIEIAFFSANRLKIELSNQRGSFSGKILADFIKQPPKFIVTTLLGNNVVLVVFGMLMVQAIETPLAEFIGSPFWAMIIQTVVSTLILLFVGEFIPKVIFKVFADTVLPLLAFPFYLVYLVLRPAALIIDGLASLTLKIFRVEVRENEATFSSVDLEKFIKDHNPNLDDEEEEVDRELFENALYLKNLKVRECMVPRKEIVAVEVNDTIAELKSAIISSNHSRILIYNENIDKLLGYVHHFDLHKRPKAINDVLIPIRVVPESMPLQKLLNIFIKENKSIAWVVNEYGGTAGIITLEDILEEIFGEIEDEYDHDEYVENQLSATEYMLSGRLEIDHINEEYGLEIPDDEYETLSGFIISNSGKIPEKDEIINIGRYTFKIMDVSDTKIETVKLTLNPPEDLND